MLKLLDEISNDFQLAHNSMIDENTLTTA